MPGDEQMDMEKVRSIGVMRKRGRTKRTVEMADGATVITDEHWDGRKDATVRPDVVRYGAKVHKTGKRKGEVAEVTEMTRKERKERYGE